MPLLPPLWPPLILSFGHRPIVRNIDNQSLYVEQFISWSFQNVWRPLLNLWSIFFRLYNTLCTSLKVKNTDANPAIQRCKGFIGPKKGWVGGLRDNEGRARLYKCFIVSKKAGKLHFRSSCRSTCVRLGLNLLAWWHRVCLSDLSVRQTKKPRSAVASGQIPSCHYQLSLFVQDDGGIFFTNYYKSMCRSYTFLSK